jgi:hypothetical protein
VADTIFLTVTVSFAHEAILAQMLSNDFSTSGDGTPEIADKLVTFYSSESPKVMNELDELKIPMFGTYEPEGSCEGHARVFAADGRHWIEVNTTDGENPAVTVPRSGRPDVKNAQNARSYWAIRTRAERRMRRRASR